MIIDKYVEIKGHPRNIEYLRKNGYIVEVGKPCLISVKHIKSGSPISINCKCDNCGLDKTMPYREYYSYTNGLENYYYCNSCKFIRTRSTNIIKYGVDNPMKSSLIKEKLKKSIENKYGVSHFSKTDTYKDKYKATCLLKYGVDNASKSEIVKKQISDIKFLELNSLDIQKSKISNDYEIISYSNNRIFKILHKECCLEFEIFIGTLNDRSRNGNIICMLCNPIDQKVSSGEIELKNFIIESGFKIIQNSYSIIPPLSLDIFIPELKIAFEFNGVYWHSEVYKNKNYHIDKTNTCMSFGIELIHIWEDDWLYKKDIVKSIILNKLKVSGKRIFARNCIIKEVSDTKIVRSFLNSNHIQGYSNSSIKVGLYFNNELVSLMVFGKKRKNMELVRFCNKIGYSIVGGSSKLFRYFLNTYEIEYIESYSDISIFNGNMYDKLGFKFVNNTSPNYWWVVDGVRKHRFNFNKKILIKNGNDGNLSESQIMNSLKYYKLYGCGLKKWVYKK